MADYDLTKPWNSSVTNPQALPLINDDADTIRVEAGPGTGKTFGLVRRVQRILHPDGLGVDGAEVLVVAFNRVIAKDLESAILKGLKDVPHNTPPTVRTVHGLCLEVIGRSLRLLLPNERDCMLYDVLTENQELHRTYVNFEGAAQALRDHEAGHARHTTLWQAARNWLIRHKAQLVSDLPALLLERLQSDDVPARSYQHVIVDEFQDLTAGEQELFLRLRRPGGHLVVLGDRRQSIYRFRGNDREGLDKLRPGVHGIQHIQDIPLAQCTRCPANVVEAANQLMAHHGAAMLPGRPENGDIHVVVWKSVEAEAEGMAKAIVANFKKHPNDRHLVMVSRRPFGFLLRDRIAVLEPELAVDLSFSEGILDSWPVREAFLYLSLRASPDPATWRAWFGYRTPVPDHGPIAPNRNAAAYLKLLASSGDAIDEGTVAALAAEKRGTPRGVGGANLWDRATRYITLKEALPFDDEEAPESFIGRVLTIERWQASTEEESTAALDMALIQRKALEHLATLPNEWPAIRKLQAIISMLRYHIATREPFESSQKPGLKVATLWGAKGVTAEHVYVIGLCAEAVPGTRRSEYPGTDAEFFDEQQRLFYVSLTRAKQTLVLSRARGIAPSRALRLGLQLDQVPRGVFWVRLEATPFLRDIRDYLPQAVAGEEWAGC